jgi:hypothetical protein
MTSDSAVVPPATAETARPAGGATGTTSASRPYAPSWANALTAWFERLPGPTWTVYLVAMAVGGLLVSASGLAGPAGWNLGTAYYGVLPFAILGLIGSLDRAATGALGTLRPLLTIDDAELADLHYELTVIPARPGIALVAITTVLTPIGYALDPVGSGVVGLSPRDLVARDLWETLVASLFLILVYHTFRQLRLIARTHDRIERIDAFDQGPLYSMSRVTSRTAVGLVLLLLPSLFLIPSGADVAYIAISAVWYGVAVGIAALAFVLPLRGMHDRLGAEKRRLQGEVGRRISTTLEAVHRAVDGGDGAAIEARNRALSALIAERDLVNRIPTWPWSTGALTGFVSAVFLPIGLWVATRLLERFV